MRQRLTFEPGSPGVRWCRLVFSCSGSLGPTSKRTGDAGEDEEGRGGAPRGRRVPLRALAFIGAGATDAVAPACG